MVYSLELRKKNILITGGYGYLGSAIVESLAFHEANVFVLGRNKEKFDVAFQHLDEKIRKKISFQACDIRTSSSLKNAFEAIATKVGTIDVLINNAIYLKGQSPLEMTDEEWQEGIDGTLNSVFRASREIIPYFLKNGYGKIINVSSMYGLVAPDFEIYNEHSNFLNPPHYGVAKAGVIQLTKYYASYLGKNNIQVNCVVPGPFPSTSVQKATAFIEELKKKTSLNRIGKPEDLAGIFVFLSSDAANFITGQNFTVDGGWTSK